MKIVLKHQNFIKQIRAALKEAERRKAIEKTNRLYNLKIDLDDEYDELFGDIEEPYPGYDDTDGDCNNDEQDEEE